MLHLFIVVSDVEFATFTRFIIYVLLAVTSIQEAVLFPILGRLIKALHFVSHTCMLDLEAEHLVQVKVRWLKSDSTSELPFLVYLLELVHRLRPLSKVCCLVWVVRH